MHKRLLEYFMRAASRWGMPLGAMSGTSYARPGFGIDQLPDGLGVLPCGSPAAFVVHSQAVANTWQPALFKDALAAGRVFLVADDKSWVDQLLTLEALQTAFISKQLTVMLTRPQLGKEIQQRGIAYTLDELKDNGLDSDHTILWVGANAWLHELNLEQLQASASVMRHWSARRKKPLAFIFLNPADAGALTKVLGNMFGLFPSVAMLSADRNWPTLSLERWNSDKGAVFQLNCGLVEDKASQRLGFNGCLTHGSMQEIIEAPDRDVVIVTQAAVARQRNVPSDWKILGPADDVALAAAGSVAATLVLHAGSIDDFGTLSRMVHHLRMTHPRSLKIVVRENDAKLRVNTELALLYLGANLIAYREIGFARLIHMIRDIRDQTFAGELDADYDTALSSFKPDIESGYLAPARFCDTIFKTLARTKSSGIAHTLVQLHILPIIPHLDAVNACAAFRDGDLMTADTESLFVFLFACTETDVDTALERLFTVPVTQLFSSQVTDSSTDGIKIMLGRLFEASRKGLPNYSAVIQHPSGNVISVAFHHNRSPADGAGVDARLPLLDAKPELPALEPSHDLQAPTFRPRVIRRLTRAARNLEQAA